jgi:hypothetical protein
MGFKVDVSVRQRNKLAEVPAMLTRLANAFESWHTTNRNTPLMKDAVVLRYAEYCNCLFADYARALTTGNHEDFAMKYLSSFWTLTAQKS